MIGKKLKLLRKAEGLTQGELAKRLSISRSALSLYEIDKRDPDFELLRKICNTLGVTADYFINEDENAIPQSHSLTEEDYEAINAARKIDPKKPFSDEKGSEDIRQSFKKVGWLNEDGSLTEEGHRSLTAVFARNEELPNDTEKALKLYNALINSGFIRPDEDAVDQKIDLLIEFLIASKSFIDKVPKNDE